MTNDTLRIVVLVLPALPLVGAIVAAALGTRRLDAIRWLSLAVTVIDLVLALWLAVGFTSLPPRADTGTFQPEFVPGAPGPVYDDQGQVVERNPHATAWDILPFGLWTDVRNDKNEVVKRLPAPALQLYLGIDGINLWLIVLTALLMVSAVLVSWRSIHERANEYYGWLLALSTAMLGVFLSFDVLLFYVFFELTLVPLYFLIGIWGGPQRQYAANKFFIYTLTGSLITLLGVLAVVVTCASTRTGQFLPGDLTFSIPQLVERVESIRAGQTVLARETWMHLQVWIFLALFAGFAIKVPLVPLHTWLPLAHVEAPTAGSVLLAGVLLKIGAYGFLRFCLPLTPDASYSVGVPLIGTLAVIGIIYGAFCALAQEDIKKLVAYSSVSHLGFCMLGLFALNAEGLSGGLLQMVNHGLSTGALFLLVGMLYERYHTRHMADYGGMAARLKLLGCFFVFICLTSVGLPGLNGFVGEALVLMGSYRLQFQDWQQWPALAVFAAAGIVLGAWYLFTLLRRVFFGPVKEPAHEGHGPVGDLNLRELAALLPIAAACVFLGVYPQPVLDAARPDLQKVVGLFHARPGVPPAVAETPERQPGAEGGSR